MDCHRISQWIEVLIIQELFLEAPHTLVISMPQSPQSMQMEMIIKTVVLYRKQGTTNHHLGSNLQRLLTYGDNPVSSTLPVPPLVRVTSTTPQVTPLFLKLMAPA